jgi:hypothetical protein
MGVDESHHHLSRRSSSACAKYADALRKISWARRSSFTSRSSNFSRVLSSESCAAGALRRLTSLRHQRRSVSVVQPILPAIDVSAAYSDAESARCSPTMRTARSRTSGTNLFDVLFIVQAPSHIQEPPKSRNASQSRSRGVRPRAR